MITDNGSARHENLCRISSRVSHRRRSGAVYSWYSPPAAEYAVQPATRCVTGSGARTGGTTEAPEYPEARRDEDFANAGGNTLGVPTARRVRSPDVTCSPIRVRFPVFPPA